MRVYLDNNIIVSIEKNEIDIEDLREKFGADSEFVYSYIHIEELLETGVGFDKLRDKRLNNLREITKSRQIVPFYQNINSEFLIYTVDPQSVLSTVQSFHSLGKERIKVFADKFDSNRELLVKALGIDIKRLNNYSVDEVVNCINIALTNNLYIDLRTLLNCMGLLLHEQILSIFNVLDVIGFWKDEKTERSNISRLYDASHTYFASGCNIFVSNDKRCRAKAKVAYKLNNIGTEIIEWDMIQRHQF